MKKLIVPILACLIIASCNSGKPSGEYSNYYLTKASVGLYAGESDKVEMRLRGCKVRKAVFSSSDETVAVVNSKGKITAVSDGLAEVTATAPDGGTAKLYVRVYYPEFLKYENPFPGKFPVLAWIADIYEKEDLQDLVDAGFNYALIGGARHEGKEDQLYENAKGLDLKLICPGWHYVEKQFDDFGDPNFGMLYLSDEPEGERWKFALETWKQYREKNDKADVYVNFNDPIHDEYRFQDAPWMNYYSYDCYCVLPAWIRKQYYGQMSASRVLGYKYAVPVWRFTNSVKHLWYAYPEIGHIRYQIFTDLAFGSQGFEYFTYTSPEEEEYYEAPLVDGKKTEIYDFCKTVNAELQAFAPYLLGAQAIDVMGYMKVDNFQLPDLEEYTDSKLPYPFTSITRAGRGILVSHLIKDGQEYMLLQNANPFKSDDYTLTWEEGAKPLKFSDGKFVPASPAETITAGNVILYKL